MSSTDAPPSPPIPGSGPNRAEGTGYRYLLAWGIAFGLLVARGFDLGPSGLRLTVVVLFPWWIAVGVPLVRTPRGGAGRAALGAVGGLLPVLALAARLDHEAGFELAELARGAGIGLFLAALFAFASARAPARSSGSARVYATLWCTLFVGLPTLRLAFPEATASSGLWSPLSWLGAWVRTGSEVPPAAPALLASGLAVLVLFLPSAARDGGASA